MGKRLEKILRKEKFEKKEDWFALMPEDFTKKDENGSIQTFRAIDLYRAQKEEKGAKIAKWSNLLIWTFLKMGILEIAEKKGRSKIYKVSSMQ